jgi:hypothetical protein
VDIVVEQLFQPAASPFSASIVGEEGSWARTLTKLDITSFLRRA